MEQTPQDMEETEPWYFHKVYARYWKHYDIAMRWMHRHREAYRKAMESFYPVPWPPSAASPSSRYWDWDGDDPPCNHHHVSSYSPRGRAQQYTDAQPGREDADRDSETEEDSESEEELEYDLSDMEITEELRQFFAQTERHREELRMQQQLEAEQQAMYVEADQDLYRSTKRSVEPPAERPGERRMAEMEKLYGDEAAKILAMETAMQLVFDRNCDKKQPKYWPIIPLKL
ncbi:GEMI8 protein, partial [Penelope pileata]|nr:GEMI8 protein [Penelope pileata]